MTADNSHWAAGSSPLHRCLRRNPLSCAGDSVHHDLYVPKHQNPSQFRATSDNRRGSRQRLAIRSEDQRISFTREGERGGVQSCGGSCGRRGSRTSRGAGNQCAAEESRNRSV